ncbi:MAG TPA: SpoIIE family protein phosphatase [Leptospiraceae bacterium]|nr:SpoIIE family protein phosphatase [Leptospiraceae bacterium]
MSEIQKVESRSVGMFVIPEITARRLNKILRTFVDHEQGKDIEAILESIVDPATLSRIMRDNHFWISSANEQKILSKIQQKIPLEEIFFNMGKEFFLADCFEILPTDDVQLEFEELISRIPILINQYIRYIEIKTISYSKNKLSIEFKFDKKIKENAYDLIFLRGILEGAAILFQVVGCKTTLLETSLEKMDERFFETHSNTKFNSKKCVVQITWIDCKIKVGKTNINKISPAFETKTFVISTLNDSNQGEYSYIDLNDIFSKSKELYIENRDLEAAVEVLKSLRNELMIKQKSITKDLKIARNIQRGIIPQRIPDWRGLQFAVSFMPMQEVSGDYYDYFNFGSNRFGILVSDVSGHGVPAAFITAISKLLFTNYKLDSPSEILGNANSELLDLVKQQGYLTCFYGIFDSNYEMTYSVAGHPRPILLRSKTKEVVVLEGEGTFLGMFDDARDHFRDYKVKLEPGDKLFVFTDGLIEAVNDAGEQFQQEKLIRFILDSADMDVKSSIDYIIKNFNQYCRGTDQGDDITLLGIGLSLNMEAFDKHHLEAERNFNNKNYELAAEHLIKANSILPNDLSILLLLGKCYAKTRNYVEAIKYLEEYNSLKTDNADSHLILGYCFYKLENYGRAELELQKSISLRSGNLPALYNLAKTFAKENYPDKALDTINKILVIDPYYTPALKLKNFLMKKLS